MESKNKKINIGILGCASIAEKSVIPAILELKSKFNLVAIASRSLSKAEKLANEFGCKAIEGYENLLTENIDAIYIPLPTGLHHEWITKALKAGKHVYAEKSIAISFESAKYMVELAQQNDLVLMEGYMFQYHPQHRIVKNLLKENKIGEIRSFRSSFGFPPLLNNNFRYDKYLGGGALLDVGGYTLRSINFILEDDFEIVASCLKREDINSVDIFGNAFLINNSGVAAHISFGFDNYYQCSYEIWGSLGKIIVNKAFTPKKNENTKIIIESQNIIQEIIVEASNQFEAAFNSFHSKIFNKAERLNEFNNILKQSMSIDQINNMDEFKDKKTYF
jgi:predicted dehydrogenase